MESSEISNKPSDKMLEDDLILPSRIGGCKFSCSEDRDRPEVNDEFYFESDHLALKGNQDYLTLLKTLSVLQAQKIQTVRDLDLLLDARDRAMADPIPFVEALQRGERLKLPGPIKIAEIPQIDWSKYDLDELNSAERRPSKRASKTSVLQSSSIVKTEVVTAGSSNAKIEKTDDGDVLVRGRIFKNYKPKNFNQPWTVDEQTRLEELLQHFPTEDVEMERWKKIAGSLGNRTAVQVQSRVQKYFLKLHKAGLPIPGRLPPQRNKNRYMKSVKRHNRYGKFANILTGRKSTFLASVLPKVKMDDFEVTDLDSDYQIVWNMMDAAAGQFTRAMFMLSNLLPLDPKLRELLASLEVLLRIPALIHQDGVFGPFYMDDSSDGLFSTNVNGFDSSNGTRDSFEEESVMGQVSSSSSSEDEALPGHVKESAEYKELRWLVRVRREKEHELRHGSTVHVGRQCRRCHLEPILGTYWTCQDCQAVGTPLHLCNQCAPQHFTLGAHKENHKFRPVRKAADTSDHDVGTNLDMY